MTRCVACNTPLHRSQEDLCSACNSEVQFCVEEMAFIDAQEREDRLREEFYENNSNPLDRVFPTGYNAMQDTTEIFKGDGDWFFSDAPAEDFDDG